MIPSRSNPFRPAINAYSLLNKPKRLLSGHLGYEITTKKQEILIFSISCSVA